MSFITNILLPFAFPQWTDRSVTGQAGARAVRHAVEALRRE